MKVIKCTEYGGPEVLKISKLKKPIPKDNEILIKVHASTVTSGAVVMRSGKHPSSKFFTVMLRLFSGIKKPRKQVSGYEVAGEVEALGSYVDRFEVGDRVFGTTTGLPFGAYAEYVCVPQEWKAGVVAKIPENIAYDEIVALPIGGMTALHLLKKVNLKKGQKVLVYGASGSVGTFAIQLCKAFEANVTGVCSLSNLDLVKSLGADKVIDYNKEDFTNNSDKYDVIFDAVGYCPSSKCSKCLTKNGKYTSISSPTSEKTEALLHLRDLMERGTIKPFIDKIFPIEQIVEAHSYVDKGHKKGNVVISVNW